MAPSRPRQERKATLVKIHFEEPQFAFQFLRIVGAAASRQADIGESFATANRIVDGDFESTVR